ncbi:Hypothetical protein PFR_JS21-2_724 [Propionibacterium freudenreichii]|nr:Hypothetical protein PFR_JS4_394 [Propionibacterium freudenreichii]SCQ55027.1 Hypothetical protein PFR_JS21-1_725 [Propionibacterium freudenreichii]SCQ60416.1 Hypothetical protein PFR_JS21-2_724 [Propionibacterium freudenreichii]
MGESRVTDAFFGPWGYFSGLDRANSVDLPRKNPYFPTLIVAGLQAGKALSIRKSTMSAAVKESLPSYTPEEEKLVIRNKQGVPVGVKPHNKWTARKLVLWVVITALGVLGWTMLAIVRGEEVNTIWFVVTAVCTYAIAYRFYGLYIQRKIMRPDDTNATPAERVNNGKDFDGSSQMRV